MDASELRIDLFEWQQFIFVLTSESASRYSLSQLEIVLRTSFGTTPFSSSLASPWDKWHVLCKISLIPSPTYVAIHMLMIKWDSTYQLTKYFLTERRCRVNEWKGLLESADDGTRAEIAAVRNHSRRRRCQFASSTKLCVELFKMKLLQLMTIVDRMIKMNEI